MTRATNQYGELQELSKCNITTPYGMIRLKILPEISDSKGANYTNEPITGRTTPLTNYSYSEPRTITMDMTFAITTWQDIEDNLTYLRLLESLVYPGDPRGSAPFTPPPVSKIICGKLLGDDPLCVILKSVSPKFPTDVPWDLETYLPYNFSVNCQWEVVYACENLPTKSLSINSDSSSDNSYNMEVIDGKLVFRFKGSQDNVSTSTEQASSTNKIAEILTFDQSGNAIFAGQIKADKIVANNIVGLDIMAENFTRISNDVFAAIASSSQESSVKVLASTTEKHGIQISNIIASTTDIINKLTDLQASSTLLASIFTVSNDGLVIDKPVSLKNGLTVDKIGSNTEVLSLIGNVEFFGRPYFTTDTAGFAIIKSGSKKVNVVFEKEYLEQPIVNTTISINDSSTDADLDVDSVFRNDIRYVITNKSVHGFTIVLNKTNERDIQFSWIALAVRNAKTASSTQIDMQIAPNIQNNLPIINKVNSPVIELNNSSTTVQTNIGTTSVEQSIPANSNASTTSVDTNVNQSTVSTPSVENTNTPSTTTQSSTSETSKSTDTQTSTQTNAQEQGINTVAPSVPAQTNAETTNTPSATQSSPSETSQTSSSGSDSTSTGN
jgi:hypothetical protein